MQQGAPKITAKSTMQQQRIPRNTKYRRKEHQEQQRTLRRAHDMAEKSTKKYPGSESANNIRLVSIELQPTLVTPNMPLMYRTNHVEDPDIGSYFSLAMS